MLNLADVVDLELQLRRDAGRDTRERDRALGRRFGKMEAPRTLLRAWLEELRRGEGPWPGRGVRRVLSLFRGLLVLLGLLLGAGAALAALTREPGAPVNVVRAWGLLVAPQILLLLVTLLALARRGSGGFQLDLFDLLSGRRRSQLHELVALGGRYRVLLRWWVVESFQIAAVAANAAILGAILVRLQFWQLAFGWETTFAWTPDILHRLVAWIAVPWDGALPPELVAATRWQGAPWPAELAARSAAWWPFLFMSVVVYGLLPRAVLLVAARIVLRREEGAAFERGGDYRRLIGRLRDAVLSTQEDPATAGPNERRSTSDDGRPAPPTRAPRGVALWQLPAAARAAFPPAAPSHGLYDPDDEPRAIDALAAAPGDAVVVLVPAWGNATTALKGFLRSLRARLGDTPVKVVPVDEGDGGAWTPGSDAVRAVWRRDLAELRDAWIWVEAP